MTLDKWNFYYDWTVFLGPFVQYGPLTLPLKRSLLYNPRVIIDEDLP